MKVLIDEVARARLERLCDSDILPRLKAGASRFLEPACWLCQYWLVLHGREFGSAPAYTKYDPSRVNVAADNETTTGTNEHAIF